MLQRRCFADTAVSTQLKEPDWEAFGAIVTSDEGKRELATLRSQFAEIKTRLTTQSQVRMASGCAHKTVQSRPAHHASVAASILMWHGLSVMMSSCITQAPQEVKWDQFKDVEPVVLEGFKSAMSSASFVPGDFTSHQKHVMWQALVSH